MLAHRQKEVDEWVKWVKAGTKTFRAKRSAAYLRNKERYGEWKAKRIAMAITRKQKGTYDYDYYDTMKKNYYAERFGEVRAKMI